MKIVLFLCSLGIIFLCGQNIKWIGISDFKLTHNIGKVVNANNLIKEDFPLGWYDIMNRPQTPKKIAKENFKFVLPYGGSSRSMIENYLNASEEAEVKVLLPINPNLEVVKLGDTLGVTQKVRAFKKNKAIYAWYIADEPDFNKVPPKLLESVYQAVKKEDPTRPIAIAFNSNAYLINKYKKAFDILMYDKYPCVDGYLEFSEHRGVNIDFTRKRVRQLGKYANATNKVFFPIIQGFGKPHDPMNLRRFCTKAEERYLIYTSILSSADGLFFWAHFATEQSWIDSVLTPLIKELKVYLPEIKNKPYSCNIRSDRLNIKGCLYKKPDSQEYLLIAVHDGKSTVEASLTLKKDIKTTSAKVLEEERLVNFQDRTIKDTFKPYEVHIYQLSES